MLAGCAALTRWHGVPVSYLPVDTVGLVDPDAVADALAGRGPAVVSVMVANNETGTIQPIRTIAAAAHAHGAPLHVDAAQAAGKIRVDVDDLGADLLTVVGHKMYAPKGVAALYVRAGTSLEPVIYGGGQERGLRAGTENVALIAAFGVAADLARLDLAAGGEQRLTRLRDRLQRGLHDAVPGRTELNGAPDRRLPNTLNISVAGVAGHDLLAGTPPIAASVGSACHSGDRTPSPVLTAMGLAARRALGAVRLSVGRWTTEEEIDRAVDALAATAARLIGSAGGPIAG